MYQTIKRLTWIMLLPVSAIFTGCASIGESDFKCKGYPEGLPCTSVQEVYELTDGDDYEQQISKASFRQGERVEPKSYKKKGRKDDDEIEKEVLPEKVIVAPVPDHSKSIIPLRTPSKVMRVQIRPWESNADVLVIPGYHFVDIQPGRWLLGNKEVVKSDRLITIQQPKSSAASVLLGSGSDSDRSKGAFANVR